MNIEKLNSIKEILIKMEEYQVELINPEESFQKLSNEEEETLQLLAELPLLPNQEAKELYEFYLSLNNTRHKYRILHHLLKDETNPKNSLNVNVLDAFYRLNPSEKNLFGFIKNMEQVPGVEENFLFITSYFQKGLGGFSKLSNQELLTFLKPFYIDRRSFLSEWRLKEVAEYLSKLQEENKLLTKQYLTQEEMLELLSKSIDNTNIISILSSSSLLNMLENKQITRKEYQTIIQLILKEKEDYQSVKITGFFTEPNLERLITASNLSMEEVIRFVQERQKYPLKENIVALRMFEQLLSDEWCDYCLATHENPLVLSQKFASWLQMPAEYSGSFISHLDNHKTDIIRILENGKNQQENFQEMEELINFIKNLPPYTRIMTLNLLDKTCLSSVTSFQEALTKLKPLEDKRVDLPLLNTVSSLIDNDCFEEMIATNPDRKEVLSYLVMKEINTNAPLYVEKLDTVTRILTSRNFLYHVNQVVENEQLFQLIDMIFTCDKEWQLTNLYQISTEEYQEISPDTYLLLLHYMKENQCRDQITDKDESIYRKYIRQIDTMIESKNNKVYKKRKK